MRWRYGSSRHIQSFFFSISPASVGRPTSKYWAFTLYVYFIMCCRVYQASLLATFNPVLRIHVWSIHATVSYVQLLKSPVYVASVVLMQGNTVLLIPSCEELSRLKPTVNTTLQCYFLHCLWYLHHMTHFYCIYSVPNFGATCQYGYFYMLYFTITM